MKNGDKFKNIYVYTSININYFESNRNCCDMQKTYYPNKEAIKGIINDPK